MSDAGKKPKIVVMEKIEMSESQKQKLKALGEVTFYDNIPNPEQAAERAKDADIIIIDWTDINPILDKLQKTKLIALMSTSYSWINVKKAGGLGITVTNVPEYATEAVAEHTFGLIFSVLRKIVKADVRVRKGMWEKALLRGTELKGKTMGIIGLGRIGRRVSEIAQAFHMRVIANDIKPKKCPGVEMVSLQEVLRESDILSLHCDLNPTSKGLIGDKEFNLMKPSAIFINTASGRIVDTSSLVRALKEKRIAGAGIDTVYPEPLPESHPLLCLENVVITPHIAYNTEEALRKRMDICITNIEAFLKGKPQNVVN